MKTVLFKYHALIFALCFWNKFFKAENLWE